MSKMNHWKCIQWLKRGELDVYGWVGESRSSLASGEVQHFKTELKDIKCPMIL